MTDAGWYQCTAISPAGTAITKCKVTVIRMCLIFFESPLMNFRFIFLLALSEAGQYAKDLPQFGPQQLSKLPRYVLLMNLLFFFIFIVF
jgi:hypothetical protein